MSGARQPSPAAQGTRPGQHWPVEGWKMPGGVSGLVQGPQVPEQRHWHLTSHQRQRPAVARPPPLTPTSPPRGGRQPAVSHSTHCFPFPHPSVCRFFALGPVVLPPSLVGHRPFHHQAWSLGLRARPQSSSRPLSVSHGNPLSQNHNPPRCRLNEPRMNAG